MKFQDDISNMNTYIHTYGQAETNMSPLFKVGGIKTVIIYLSPAPIQRCSILSNQ